MRSADVYRDARGLPDDLIFDLDAAAARRTRPTSRRALVEHVAETSGKPTLRRRRRGTQAGTAQDYLRSGENLQRALVAAVLDFHTAAPDLRSPEVTTVLRAYLRRRPAVGPRLNGHDLQRQVADALHKLRARGKVARTSSCQRGPSVTYRLADRIGFQHPSFTPVSGDIGAVATETPTPSFTPVSGDIGAVATETPSFTPVFADMPYRATTKIEFPSYVPNGMERPSQDGTRTTSGAAIDGEDVHQDDPQRVPEPTGDDGLTDAVRRELQEFEYREKAARLAQLADAQSAADDEPRVGLFGLPA